MMHEKGIDPKPTIWYVNQNPRVQVTLVSSLYRKMGVGVGVWVRGVVYWGVGLVVCGLVCVCVCACVCVCGCVCVCACVCVCLCVCVCVCVCVSCQAVLAQRQEGDSRIEELRAQAQRLAKQEGLCTGQNTDVQHLVQDALAQWVTLQQDTEQLSRYSTLNSTLSL